MRFETKDDLINEELAISLFCDIIKAKFEKLGEKEVDFKVIKGKIHFFVEVKGRNRNLKDAYPLPIAARKLVKLCDKGDGVIIWKCHDGIIYGKVKNLHGKCRFSGRLPRQEAVHDNEIMIYFDKQKGLKELAA